MLSTLSIRDFVIVDALELDFSSGFTVFSGETGAGKSILVDALSVLLGGRAESIMVREGAKRAEISARCALTEEARAWLAANDVDHEDGEALLRRVIDKDGRSRASVNGAAVTLAQLRELGELLVDIYGQHAHQALLKRSAQRDLLDAHAGLGAELRQLADASAAWRRSSEAVVQAKAEQSGMKEREERLRWQFDELERLNVGPLEWQEIQAEHERLANAAALIEAAQAGVDLLLEADDALLPRLAPLISRLSQLASHDVRLSSVLDALEPARIQLQEAAHALNQYLGHLELDPDGLKRLDARLEAIHSTARKLRIAPELLNSESARLGQELKELTAAFDIDALHLMQQQAQAHYMRLAVLVSERRKACAVELGAAVSTAMQTLSMQGGRFEIALEPCAPSAAGLEQVEFLVAAHPGVETRALSKVASGGELARISLAISVIASTSQSTPTLVFDEVDSGIGGAVAEVVGRLLRQLAQQRQVLCVTHLPQVAARAEHHFVVSKTSVGAATVSAVTSLSSAARVDELARMLGGIEITSTTRQHAREMLSLGGERA